MNAFILPSWCGACNRVSAGAVGACRTTRASHCGHRSSTTGSFTTILLGAPPTANTRQSAANRANMQIVSVAACAVPLSPEVSLIAQVRRQLLTQGRLSVLSYSLVRDLAGPRIYVRPLAVVAGVPAESFDQEPSPGRPAIEIDDSAKTR